VVKKKKQVENNPAGDVGRVGAVRWWSKHATVPHQTPFFDEAVSTFFFFRRAMSELWYAASEDVILS